MLTGWSWWWWLTEGRGSPDLTPGHRRTQTSSAPSTWFHGDLAGWTGCGGRGSLERKITEIPKRHSQEYRDKRLCVYGSVRRKPVHPLLPFRVSPLSHTPSLKFFLTTFFTSSNAWDSSGVLKHVRCESQKRCENVKIVLLINTLLTLSATVVLPGRSWARYHWESHHCPGRTLWRSESELWYKVTSSGNHEQI